MPSAPSWNVSMEGSIALKLLQASRMGTEQSMGGVRSARRCGHPAWPLSASQQHCLGLLFQWLLTLPANPWKIPSYSCNWISKVVPHWERLVWKPLEFNISYQFSSIWRKIKVLSDGFPCHLAWTCSRGMRGSSLPAQLSDLPPQRWDNDFPTHTPRKEFFPSAVLWALPFSLIA